MVVVWEDEKRATMGAVHQETSEVHESARGAAITGLTEARFPPQATIPKGVGEH